jgi:hypothetical protein
MFPHTRLVRAQRTMTFEQKRQDRDLLQLPIGGRRMNLQRKFLDALREMEVKDFIAQFYFDRIPFIFAGNRRAFIDWKYNLAKGIEVDPSCLSLVGSSAIGISLNPSKGFKVFDESSDVDVAVVSNYHFTVSWRYLRTNGHRRTRIDSRTRTAWDEHVTRFIYWGTIATDRLLGILPFGKQWLDALTTMGLLAPTVGRDINLRIYSDYESLRAYQVQSVFRAREELITGGSTDATIS